MTIPSTTTCHVSFCCLWKYPESNSLTISLFPHETPTSSLSTMGKPAFSLFFVVHLRLEPNHPASTPGSGNRVLFFYGVVSNSTYPRSRHRTTLVWLHHSGVPFSFPITHFPLLHLTLLCVAIFCISLLLSTIFPPYCAIPRATTS